MKLYCTRGEISTGKHYEYLQVWDGTQADAKKTRVKMKADGADFIDTLDVEVPTSKPELIAFLNAHHLTAKGK